MIDTMGKDHNGKGANDYAVFQHERPEPAGVRLAGHRAGPVGRGRPVCARKLPPGGRGGPL